MRFPGGGTHITRDMCFPGRGTHITRDMCFPGGGTHITRDMCFPGREHISLGLCVSQAREHISVGMCVSQVTGGKNIKVAGDSAGCRCILTTLSAPVFSPVNIGPGPRGTRKSKVESITLPYNFDDSSSIFNFFP